MAFSLRKWYLDCVTPAGDAAIVYSARVALGPVSIPYVEVMTAPAVERNSRHRRLLHSGGITLGADGLTLDAPSVRTTGRWNPRCPPIHVTLMDDHRGTIRWRCHQPAGRASLRLPDAKVRDGLGYAEELDMTVAPWALPFRELRWGRFIGERRSVVWIDWRGGLDRRWVFADGLAVDASVVERDRVAWAGQMLAIEPGRVWREGRLGDTVAGVFGRWMPQRVANAVETKWISSAVLRSEADADDTGWVIHEVVRWG